MKFFIILCILFINLFAEKLTIQDLQSFIAMKYKKSIIIDAEIMNDFMIYSESFEDSISLSLVKQIVKAKGYKYLENDTSIFITQKTKDENEEYDYRKKLKKEKDKIYIKKKTEQLDTEIIYTELSLDTVKSLCAAMKYECTYLTNSKYLVSSKTQKIDNNLFAESNKNSFFLDTQIYEFNLQKAKENDINLTTLISKIFSSSSVSLNLLGQIGSIFNDSQTSEISSTLTFKLLEENGITKTISNPILSLTDNYDTVFKNGDTITVVSSTTTDAENRITQSYKNVDTGLYLKVKSTYYKDSVGIDLAMAITSLLTYDKDKNIASVTTKSLNGKYNLKLDETLNLVSFKNTFASSNETRTPLLSNSETFGSLFSSDSDALNEKFILISMKLTDVAYRIVKDEFRSELKNISINESKKDWNKRNIIHEMNVCKILNNCRFE